MTEVSSTQIESEPQPLPQGNPMNLTCTSAPGEDDAGTVYTIVLVGPDGPTPITPPGSTTLIAPNPNVEWNLTGTGPDGNKVPDKFKLTGVLVYSTP